MIDINDYLMDQGGADWGQRLADFVPPLPAEFTIWMVNRFGDVFAMFEDGSVHLLDVGGGALMRLADSQDDFCDRVDQDGNADNWFMIPMVDACVAAGMTLQAGECFGYKVPPFLGGAYSVENVEPTDIRVHFGVLGELHKQTRGLADGTKINSVRFVD